ncbi:hypothetical protein [Aliamphritea ceti]|uniref:hypothetical protein n=1 Tax=Aliamphritea ceti TaxID=1524258 RepID=UPI0021C3252B|nr:hypothetical protein [Aliamphritea ceti]
MAILNNKQFTVMGVLIGVGVWYASRKVGSVAEKAIDAVNPLNNDNVISSGVDSVGAEITGIENWNLGGAIYDGVNSVRGLYGDSDADRMTERETELRRQHELVAKFKSVGGGF